MKKWQFRLLLASVSLLFAVVFLYATGLVESGGHYYGQSIRYREQTDALLAGRLALFNSPGGLTHDLTWSEGGVHQVWGLGVPFWRLPWEALARWCGQPAFPDRLAFGLAHAVVIFWVLIVLVLPSFQNAQDKLRSGGLLVPLAGALLLLIFPSFVTLCHTRFEIYEEAIAYAYLYSIGLLTALLGFARQPGVKGFWCLCLLAGLSGLVRPPILAYGLATLVIAAVIAARAGFTVRQWLPGPLFFCIGGGVLWWTNRLRFGSGFEFGHALNVSDLHESMFLTRFGNPAQAVSLWDSALELVGALFRVEQFNGGHFYQSEIFAGQSEAFRFREFYFSVFDWSVAVLVAASWIMTFWLWFKSRRETPGAGQTETSFPALEPEGGARHSVRAVQQGGDCGAQRTDVPYPLWFRDTHHGSSRAVDSLPLILAAWSFLSVLPMCIFFLRYTVITSRYVHEFAPAFAAAMAAGVFALARWLGERFPQRNAGIQMVIYGLVMAWIVGESANARIKEDYESRPALTQKEIMEQQRRIWPTLKLPEEFNVGDDLRKFGNPYLGRGWDWDKGTVQPVVIFFLESPEKISLEVAAVGESELKEADVKRIQAKVGREFLRRAATFKTERGWRLVFHPPRKEGYRRGTQVVFLAFLETAELGKMSPPFRLLTVKNQREVRKPRT